MGLFKKKKGLKFLSKPAGNGPLTTEKVDFDSLLAQTPSAPQALQTQRQMAAQPGFRPPSIKAGTLPPKSPQMEKELPIFDMPAPKPAQPHIPMPGRHQEKEFELPDFDEHELRELERIRAPMPAKKEPMKKEPMGLVESAKPVREEPKKEAFRPPRPPVEISYPKPEMPRNIPEEKFVDIGLYLSAKEIYDDIKDVTNNIQGTITKQVTATKSRDDKYTAISKELNLIQEKLMLIDSKLFGGI